MIAEPKFKAHQDDNDRDKRERRIRRGGLLSKLKRGKSIDPAPCADLEMDEKQHIVFRI